MNCPYCNFRFRQLAVTGTDDLAKELIAPIVCESCGNISILVVADKAIYTLTPQQLEQVKLSPAWKVLGPAQRFIKANKGGVPSN